MSSQTLRNGIVPSTLHQVTKYEDEWGKVKTLIADRYPFKGVENYFTDFVLYQDSLEESPIMEQPDSGNEVDEELESDDNCP